MKEPDLIETIGNSSGFALYPAYKRKSPGLLRGLRLSGLSATKDGKPRTVNGQKLSADPLERRWVSLSEPQHCFGID